MLKHINLQLFSEEDTGLETESIEIPEEVEDVEQVESSDDDETSEEESTEEEPKSKKLSDKELDEKIFNEKNQQWQTRISRAKRAAEREFLDLASSMSDGVKIEKGEIPKASRLWNFLKVNPELSTKVQQLIDEESRTGSVKTLNSHKDSPFSANQSSEYEERLNLREAKIDLKLSDPVYKKYENKILEWAEDNEIDIRNVKQLQLAYKAWKGENSSLLLANAEARGQKKALEQKSEKASVKLAGKSVSSVTAPKIDYRKASAKQVLEHEGLKLFHED